MQVPYYNSPDDDFTLFQGNCIDVLPKLDAKVEMVFADPPYFLSNDGITIKGGKISTVNKGEWDRKTSHDSTIRFPEQ